MRDAAFAAFHSTIAAGKSDKTAMKAAAQVFEEAAGVVDVSRIGGMLKVIFSFWDRPRHFVMYTGDGRLRRQLPLHAMVLDRSRDRLPYVCAFWLSMSRGRLRAFGYGYFFDLSPSASQQALDAILAQEEGRPLPDLGPTSSPARKLLEDLRPVR